MNKKDKAAQEGGPGGTGQVSTVNTAAIYHDYNTEPHRRSPAPLCLERISEDSFFCSSPLLLLDSLRSQGFTNESTTNAHELTRLRNNNAGLVIVYHSGSVVIGRPAHGARVVLELLEPERTQDGPVDTEAQVGHPS